MALHQSDKGPSGGTRRTTLTAVADTAGVSIATASKVVNHRTGVSEETRQRVEHVISSLGYVSIGERQRAVNASRELTIEVIVDARDVANPYLSTWLGGAMEYAGAMDSGLVLRDVRSVASQAPVVWAHDLAAAGRSGVIEVTNEYAPEREAALRRVGLPMVLVDPIDQPRTSVASIGATNFAGAYAATRHLVELGHRRIAYIGGPEGAACDTLRIHGWTAALSEAGIVADTAAIPLGGYTFDHGLDAACRLLQSVDRPTAIFAGSDASAMGVLEAARRNDLSVPGDLSVVGFDDVLLASTSTPPLTTVHQPIGDIGRLAVSTLLRLAAGESLRTKRVELATELVIRNSTAPPKERS